MNSQKLTSGIVFLLLGLLILGRNLGWFPDFSWMKLISLWPVFLVAAGLQLLFPRGILAILSPLVIVAVFVYAISGYAIVGPNLVDWSALTTKKIAGPPPTAQAQLVLNDLRAVQFELGADLELDANEISLTSSRELAGAVRTDTQGGINQFVISAPKQVGWLHGRTQPIKVDLTPVPEWSVELNGGVINGSLGLHSFNWSDVVINAGITSLHLQLNQGQQGQRIKVSSGVAKLVLHVPRGISLRVKSSSPLPLSQLTKEGFNRSGQVYTSPEYNGQGSSIQIDINAGIASVEVIWQEQT